MRLLICAMFAALMAGAAPARAQELMMSWSPAEMKSIVGDLKGKVTAEKRSDKDLPDLAAESEKGLHFDIYGAECEKVGGIDRCRGAELVCLFTLADRADVPKALGKIDYAAVDVEDTGDGNIKVRRYLIFDNGVTRGNVRVNLDVFLNINHRIWDQLDTDGYFKKKS